MKAAIYARVSKGDGSQVLENQLLACRAFADRAGWTVSKEYLDESSGAKASRPGLQLLLREAAQRYFDAVIVWKLDRFGRSTLDVLRSIKTLEDLGVKFVSVTEGLDLSTPMGRAMAGFLATFAQLERDFIIERTNAGLARARAWGKKLGGKPIPPEKEEAIRTLGAQGKSCREIAKETGVSAPTVSRVLRPKSGFRSLGKPNLKQPPGSETR